MINYSNPSFTEHTTVVDTYLSPKAKRFCVRVALFGSIGGLLFGYDLGVVAGANFQLAESMGLSFLQQDLFVSALLVGATVGAPLGGLLTDRLGRLRAIMLTDFCFIIGTVFLCAAQGLPMLFVGRFLIGVAVSVSAIADVAYLTEVSPHSVRGAIVSMNEIMISVGVLLSFFISFLLRDVTDGWRFMFGFTGVLAALQLLGMKTVPESPSWLFEHGQERAAMRVLHEIYGYRGAEDGGGTEQGGLGGAAGARGRGEQNGPLSSSASSTDALDPAAMGRGGDGEQDRSLRLVEAEAERIRKSQEASGGAHAIDLIRYWRPQLLVGLGLMMVQQLTGQANVLYYAPEVFARAGIKGSNYAATVGLGLVKVFFTAVAVLKVDHAGRRTLLLLGSIIMTCSLSVLGMSFLPFIRGTTTASALAFAGCCCVVAAYALGDGPITWLLTSEMFPSSLRGRAIGISLTANWLFNFAVTVRFLGCLHAVGEAATFFGMSILSLLGLLFIYHFAPETLGKEPEEIAQQMAHKRQNCDDNCCCCCFSSMRGFSPMDTGGSSEEDSPGDVDLHPIPVRQQAAAPAAGKGEGGRSPNEVAGQASEVPSQYKATGDLL